MRLIWPSRLSIIAVLAAAAGSISLSSFAVQAQDTPAKRHALSLIGDPKYPPDFKHVDYVNPAAPKSGRARRPAIGTFDSLNPFLYRGVSAVGLGLVLDSLMQHTLDESSTAYCLVCEWVSYPADYSSVTFKLREGARFHDGKPITADDVVFSFEALKKNNPRYALYYKNVVKIEPGSNGLVTFHFDMTGNRELPMIVGELPILPKHYWTGTGRDGKPRDISQTTLEPPLGSGPYRIKEAVPGRSIVYERVTDYWAKDLPINVGAYNFNLVQFEYFKDTVPALEAFKTGQVDFMVESSAKNWATQYDFTAIRDGRVRKREIKLKRVQGMQAFVINLRRPKLSDPRVREALNLAFDFEWANANLFFKQYTRVDSFFANSELASRDLPTGLELEILETVRKDVPPEVFSKPYKNPVNATPQDTRNNLRTAAKLLSDAGWKNQGGAMTNASGEKLTIEILLESPAFERITLPYAQALERIGIKASVRLIDAAQYKRRLDTFDYDLVVESFPQSESPGNEQRDYWSTQAADNQGSRNVAGLKSPAVDKLVDRIVAAKSREELVAATRALDRVLLWSHIVVPHWYIGHERAAHWELFGEPKTLPSRSNGFPTVWWWDDAKAQKTLAAR